MISELDTGRYANEDTGRVDYEIPHQLKRETKHLL